MKILLISVNREKTPYPVAPLGLAYIAAALQGKGHDILVLDLCFEDDHESALKAALKKSPPDIIGISIRNIDNLTFPGSIFYLPFFKKIVETLRLESEAPIVLGGSGFSLFPEEILHSLGAEYGIIGEGESSIILLIELVGSGGDLSIIPNLIYRDGSREGLLIKNGLEFSRDFCSITPARSFIDNERYFKLGGMANIQTKRGCPFKCVYCTYPILEGSSLRLREPCDVADEIESLCQEYAIDHIFFVDDIFNIPEIHAIGICEEIVRRNIKVSWTCFVSPRSMSVELVFAMKRAGCAGVEFGTDGGADQTLDALGKGFSQSDVERAQKLCDSAGLDVAHYLILGGPGETKETLEETFVFMERLKPRAVIAMLGVRIYPETPLHALAIKDGGVASGASLLEPSFYISKEVESSLLPRVGEYAASQTNWVVPGLDIRSSVELTTTLRRLGKKGVLWDMLV